MINKLNLAKPESSTQRQGVGGRGKVGGIL